MLLIILVFIPGVYSIAEESECIPKDPAYYWSYVAIISDIEKKDTPTQRQWRKSGSHYWYCTDLERIKDPLARIEGYKWVLDKLINDYYYYYYKTGIVNTSGKKITTITGQTFSTKKQARDWWLDNREYLVWSTGLNTLIVDEQSKFMGVPVHVLSDVATKELFDLGASDYWYLLSRDLLKEIGADGIYLLVWWPDTSLHGSWRKARVVKSDLEDRTKKEEGFKNALSYMVEIFSFSTIPEGDKADIVALLPQFVDKRLKTPVDWLEWYEKNKDWLTLSKDGKKLVVK